jgi:hypothetical protein
MPQDYSKDGPKNQACKYDMCLLSVSLEHNIIYLKIGNQTKKKKKKKKKIKKRIISYFLEFQLTDHRNALQAWLLVV